MELQLRMRERQKVLQVMEMLDEVQGIQADQLIGAAKASVVALCNARGGWQDAQDRLEGSGAGSESENHLDDGAERVYDWVVDVNLLSELATKGWKVTFSKSFYDHLEEQDRSALFLPKEHLWEGAVIAVVGLYDKGKTFVLNKITQTKLPSGKKVSTKGLSFKHVKDHSGTSFVLLDSAGSYSPVRVKGELSVAEKEATEWFLLDLIFELSDYFVCVVNDFTSLDQRYLDRLTRSLQNSSKSFREVIVVHNMKEVTSKKMFKHVWKNQVTGIYCGGQECTTSVAAPNARTGELEEKQVHWFKTKYTRHVALGNEDSPLGRSMNPWTISLLRYWLKSVFVPVNRKISVVRNVIDFSNKKLSAYFNEPLILGLHAAEKEGPYAKYIRPVSCAGKFRLPQVSLDASGLMLTRPDSFLPEVDVIQDEEYIIYMDIPGMTAKDISVSRQNVMTIIKGVRELPYLENKRSQMEKRERKNGEFTLTFTIPHRYQRRWSSIEVENGVLCIRFPKDTDEDEQVCL